MNDFFKSRLVYRHFASLQKLDLLSVIIDTNHIVTDISETCAGNQANITRTNDCKIHKRREAQRNQPPRYRLNALTELSIARALSFILLQNSDRRSNQIQISGTLSALR